jgi:hypothetical protein
MQFYLLYRKNLTQQNYCSLEMTGIPVVPVVCIRNYEYDFINSPTIQWLEKTERENKMFSEIKFKKDFFEKIKSSHFEYGFLSEADKYLEEAMENDELSCFKLIDWLYRDNYDDKEFIIGLLATLAHIPAKRITPECINIVQKSLESESIDIKERAVMAFENWEYTGAIPLLEKTRFDDPFLENYLQGVIQDLKELRNGFVDQKN